MEKSSLFTVTTPGSVLFYLFYLFSTSAKEVMFLLFAYLFVCSIMQNCYPIFTKQIRFSLFLHVNGHFSR